MRRRERRAWVVRLYALLLRLLPPSVVRRDGEAIVRTFEDLWREGGGRGGRPRLLVRGFGGLAWVAVLEWADELRSAAHGRERPKGGGMAGLWRLVRHGAGSLARSPAFSWTAVLLLALGVGSVTTIFTLLDHVVLRPLPYPAEDRLVEIQNGAHSGLAFEQFQGLRSLEAMGAVKSSNARLTGGEEPLIVTAANVSREFFSLFGARPALGRLLVGDDFETGEGAVLSYAAWRDIWGSDPSVLGRSIILDGSPVVVVGVLDPEFVEPEALTRAGVHVYRPIDPADERLADPHYHLLSVAGRMTPDATLEAVQAEADGLAAARAEQRPDPFLQRDGTPAPLPVVRLREATTGPAAEGLGLLLAAVSLLLLVACANVAHLFMARGLHRVREMAVRRALGAGTRALAAQLFVESVLVGLAGALGGVALAYGGLRLFLALGPDALPRADAIAMDLRILLFAVAVSVGTALIFGLLPALRFAGRETALALRDGDRGSSGGRFAARGRAVLVVAEVALSLVLVTQAASLLRSFVEMHRVPLGFRTGNVWTVPLQPTGIEEPAEWVRRMQAIRESLATVPGIEAATFGLTMPLEFSGGGRCCWNTRPVVDGEELELDMAMHPVDTDYFSLLSIRTVAGATWSRADIRSDPVPAVVSERLAVEAFGSAADAVGRLIQLNEGAYHVRGVVEDTRHYGVAAEPGPAMYVPIEAVPFAIPLAHMAVRVETDVPALPAQLREAVWRVEPDLPVPTVRRLEDWESMAVAGARFESVLFSTFGAVALLLLAGGLYGTLLYSVGRRRREFGIRLALGAQPRGLSRLVLSHGLLLAGSGVVIGATGAWAFGRLIQSRLFGVQAGDPRTLLAAVGLLLLVAGAASLAPARRAASTDPMETLRAE